MDTVKMFNSALDKFPAVSSLKLWKFKEGFKLIAWENMRIYIINFTEEQLDGIIKSTKLPAHYEELLSAEDIVDVFCFGDKFFTVDCQCCISEIMREPLEDMQWEGDLFEDTPKKIVKSELKRKYKICNDSSLLAVSPIGHGVVSFLINTVNSVIVKIINIDSLEELHSITVRNASLNLKPHHDKCLLLFVPEENIERAYVESWFPNVKLESYSSGLIIVSLPESNICALFLDEQSISPHFMFSWPFQTVATHWLCFNDKEADRIQRKANLILVFDGGSVVTFGQYGGKTCYLPLNRIRSACISADFLLVSDRSDCYSINTIHPDEITCLPLKGLLGFCPVPDQHHIFLASSRHQTLYAINMKVKVKRETFKMPNLEIFDEFLLKNKYLEQLSKQIEETDDYINTLSYAVNSNIMKFNFVIQLVLGFVHSFRIIVSNQNSGIIFRKKIWKLSISLYSKDNCYTFVRDLEKDLRYEDYFADFISVEYQGNNWDFGVEASFVSYLGNAKYRPIVNIGNALIDISHFIQPVSCLKLHTSLTNCDNISMDDILENISTRNDECSRKKEKQINENATCIFEIPINCGELSNESIVDRLLNNCKPLWRTTELTECRKKTKFKIFIGGNLCNIEIREGFIKISGRNGDCCHSLKIAINKLLNNNYKLNLTDANVQPELEDLMKSIELLQYNTEDNLDTRFNQTVSLYNKFKDKIVYPITGIKTDYHLLS